MKTVLVTGGVRGIGKSIALAFVKKGYRVCVTYSKDEENAKLMGKQGVETYKVNVACEEDVLSLFQKLGGVDILINNAGVSLMKQIQDTSYAEYQRVFDVNVGGAFLCSREASKGMISRQNGLIVNISSVWGEVGASCEGVYSASKSALIGFTKALAKELGWSGIRVNSISPGVIDTSMNAHLSAEEVQELVNEIPANRLGTGEDVAKAVLFLEENEYVTGVDIAVNGGFSIV